MQETKEKKFTILFPQSSVDSNYLIDEHFYREVLLHFVKNKLQILNPPLILCVQGKAGEGKSSHILQICNRVGITILLIHGSSLCGDMEGEPTAIINDMYITASEYSNQCNTIILVDDIDTSIASTNEDRKYTVNSQLINGAFMSIANNPYNIGSKETKRVPIIFTGNNLMNLYAPLRRTGRIRLYSWQPTIKQKTNIIENLYKDIVGEKEKKEFFEIIQPHIDQPISFFVDLKNNLFDDIIMNEIMTHRKVNFYNIEHAVCEAYKQSDCLSKIAKNINLLATAQMQDFNK